MALKYILCILYLTRCPHVTLRDQIKRIYRQRAIQKHLVQKFWWQSICLHKVI